MITTKKTPVTRYYYSSLPDDAPRQQLIEGMLVEEPSPTSFHQTIVGNLYYLIRLFVNEHPIGKVYLSPLDTYISEINVFQPDIFFVRKKNLAIVEKHGVEGAPDLVVEVLSPSSAKYDLGQKRKAYARSGVEEMWVVDPFTHTIGVYRLGVDPEAPQQVYSARQTFLSPVLPGFTIRLNEVFNETR